MAQPYVVITGKSNLLLLIGKFVQKYFELVFKPQVKSDLYDLLQRTT